MVHGSLSYAQAGPNIYGRICFRGSVVFTRGEASCRHVPEKTSGEAEREEMTAKEKFAVLLDLAAALRNHGSWAGETHVQKATYILQTLLGVPTEFQFILYKHGPFSFDLRESLSQMEADRLVELEEQSYPYGPRIAEGKTARQLRASTPSAQGFQKEIAFVSQMLGNAGVADLERIATALFVTLDSAIAPEDRIQRLVELKPHVQPAEAEAAFARLEEIRTSALNAGLYSFPGIRLQSHAASEQL